MTAGNSDFQIRQNAGRCDLCGKPIDMSSGDVLALQEFGIEDDEVKDKYDLSDQDAIEAVADAMERVAETGAGRELARVIREEGEIRAHEDCLDETNIHLLETAEPSDGGESA